MIGMTLGDRYELLEIIGEGGMAVVYKARDKKLNRLVAVKILKKEFADNTDISEKFKKEATAIANLSDMNIVNVLDVGHEESENIDYFVMELVEGKTLKDIILSNGRISWSTASTIAIQVAKALDCAHRNGIIHRDVKPQNILITEHGDVKVTDFGIAKSATSSTITNTTTIMGSAHYLSPEQAKGTFIDFRTDLYSLGIVLYEMVTGKLPFDGESPVTIALKHIQEEPIAPKALNDSIPDALNKLILKAINKNPIDRYQSAKEMIADLQMVKENPMVNIQSAGDNDGGRTIVMAPIKADLVDSSSKSEKSHSYNEDYIEDEDDESEDDYEERKNSPNKKGKGFIIGSIIAVIIIIVGIFTVIFLGGNKDKQVSVPNIVGISIDEARSQLEALGLKLTIEKTENSDRPEGEILESNPSVDSMVNKNTVIKVVVSGGAEKISVPDFRDYEENVIKQYLESKGLKYELNYEYDDNVEKGYFLSQNPKAGTEISKEEIIYITISKGPEEKLVVVNNYIGYNITEVKSELESLNLKVTVQENETSDKQQDGIILSQNPKNTKVLEGTEVILTVGKYVEPTTDITQYLSEGMMLSDAVAVLDSQNIKYTIDGGTPPSQEISQYKVIGFTPSIKEGESVAIQIEKIESLPTDTEPDTPDSGNSNSNSNGSSNEETTQTNNN